jgi:hypothetical protein
MFVLMECPADRLSILKELAERLYGVRVVCCAPDLRTLPDRIEDAVIVDAKNRAASASAPGPAAPVGACVLTGRDLEDWLAGAEGGPDSDDDGDGPDQGDPDATPILVPA